MGEAMNQRLEIDYHPESDTLWLGNGLPTPDGEDIAENVTAFFDDDGRPNAVMIEHAAKLLTPILMAPQECSKDNITQIFTNKANRTHGKSGRSAVRSMSRREGRASSRFTRRLLKEKTGKQRRLTRRLPVAL